MTLRLPPGPSGGRVAQTVALHRDPLRFLRSAQDRFGDVFTIRLATSGPAVVVAHREAAETLPGTDPAASHAGEARRAVLPMASPLSVFGGDEAEHDAARHRAAGRFTQEAVEAALPAMRAVAREHVALFPRGRPFRLLPRMRALADELFVRFVLGVTEEPRVTSLARAIGGLLHTPGNPPLTIPGPDDGLLGPPVHALYRRRRARLAALLLDGPIALPRAPGRSDDEHVDELLALLMAAQEPMAAALTWTTLSLAGSGTGYSRGAATEALRLHPPAFGVLRKLHEPALGLPAGATAMLPIALVQRDARWWDHPDAFRPGRDGSGPLLPFGGGGRACLGQALAWAELDGALPVVLDAGLRPVGPQPERMVLRGTILVPQRGGLARI